MLAIIMHLIVKMFPKEIRMDTDKKETKSDAALYAAITSAYQNLYPGMKVKEIAENK